MILSTRIQLHVQRCERDVYHNSDAILPMKCIEAEIVTVHIMKEQLGESGMNSAYVKFIKDLQFY